MTRSTTETFGVGTPERDAVELTLELRQDERDSLGGAGGGRHNVQGGGTGATQVAVRGIQDALVTGVGVGGGHQTLDDAKLVVEHLDERRETVGRARGVGDNLVAVLVVFGVDTENIGRDVVTLGRGGDDNLLGARLKVLGRAGVSMKAPVPSMTMSTPSAFHGSWSGSRLETTSIFLPSIEMWVSSTIWTSASKVPRTESYLTKWDACFTPPESLMATTSSMDFSRPCQHRKKLRPIRPKPLMATLHTLPCMAATVFAPVALVAVWRATRPVKVCSALVGSAVEVRPVKDCKETKSRKNKHTLVSRSACTREFYNIHLPVASRPAHSHPLVHPPTPYHEGSRLKDG